MQFRKDINGLRAIAVIAVVLFHFNASWMPGGFAGVDVFFVISGFLMTGIIFRGIEQENFSILKFYVARANRIIPALAVLCLVLLVFGWFYLTPLDYKALGKHVGSSMGFLSNIIYWRESGYFDAASHEKWLLHTWSLSAEWQFYIIYPLVLVAMRKFMSLKAMKATVLVGTVLGFIFCVIATYKWPNPAYYLLPTRAWEMMIGGVAYLYPLKLAENRKKVFEWVGLALIILSYIFISKENLWPGYLALIPVLGAFLLIQAQRNDSVVTGNIIFQSLGKWSYSIYLWHWPLVVLMYFGSFHSPTLPLIASIVFGFISYNVIENKKYTKYPVALLIFSLPFSYSVYTDNKDLILAESFDIERESYLYDYSNPSCNFRPYDIETRRQLEKINILKTCYSGGSNNKSILLHGDSHSQHLFYGLNENFGSDYNIYQISAFSCRLSESTTLGCKSSNDFFMENIKKINPEVLILSTRNDMEKVNWNEYLEKVYTGNKVLILGPSPENDIFKLKYHNVFLVKNWNYMVDTDSYMSKLIQGLKSKYPNVDYISMRSLLCEGDEKTCISSLESKSIYADGGHFSRVGSKYVMNKLKASIIN